MNHEESLEELDRLVESNPGDAAALYRRGSMLWKLGRRGAAISDFNASAAIDPSGPGATAAEHAMSIMNFFNPDQFNP